MFADEGTGWEFCEREGRRERLEKEQIFEPDVQKLTDEFESKQFFLMYDLVAFNTSKEGEPWWLTCLRHCTSTPDP